MARNDASGPNRAASDGAMAPNDASGLTSMAIVNAVARSDASGPNRAASDGAMAPNDASGLTSMVSVDAMALSRGGNRAVTAASAASGTAVDAVVVGSAAAATGLADHATMAAG